MSSALPFAALGLSALSCALSAWILLHAGSPAPDLHAPDIDQLERRVRALEEALDDRAAFPPAPLMEASAPTGERTPAGLDERLRELEARVGGIGGPGESEATDDDSVDPAAQAASATEEAKKTKPDRPKRGTPEHLAWARHRVLDPALTSMERSDALGEIQKHGADGYSDEVVQAMIVLGQTDEDPKVRANVWRQFDGARNGRLANALVHALGSDRDADVRREAAEALDNLRDDPSVRAALEQAAQQDSDERVRWEALRSLRKPKK